MPKSRKQKCNIKESMQPYFQMEHSYSKDSRPIIIGEVFDNSKQQHFNAQQNKGGFPSDSVDGYNFEQWENVEFITENLPFEENESSGSEESNHENVEFVDSMEEEEEEPTTSPPPKKKRKNMKKENNFRTELLNYFVNGLFYENDENFAFGKFIATQMKQMNDQCKDEFRLQILQLSYEAVEESGCDNHE